tara:strand:- start:8 stop:580 length:573 start_codon:yes stop_codon:yes gene_type:complete
MTVFHFMQRHIDAIKHSMSNVESEKIHNLLYLLLESKGKIFFTGVGKNGHVAAKAASTFSSIGLPCFYINPVDSVHGDMGVINEDDIIVAISKSGNTEELIHFLHHVKHKNCKIVALHSNPNNSCLNYSYLDIDLHSNEEADNLNVVPTSSIAVFTVFLQSIACEIASINNLKLEEFVFNHPGGSIGKLK